MEDANFTYDPSLIIMYYSSTHFLILFFLINTFPPTLDGWCYVHFHPSFYLVLLSFSLTSFQLFHPTHGLFCFILCYLSWAYTFSMMFIPHCKYFFLSSCTLNILVLSYVYSKQSILGLTQEWFRELSFSRLECVESTTSYTFPVQTGGIFYFPWHQYRHRIEGTNGF